MQVKLKLVSKSRVEHHCSKSVFASGCGRVIRPGESYFRTQRFGIDTLALCYECGKKLTNR